VDSAVISCFCPEQDITRTPINRIITNVFLPITHLLSIPHVPAARADVNTPGLRSVIT
jgi:hypothetical protein